jgi:hypothetical protein
MALAWSAQLAFVPGAFGDPAGLVELGYPALRGRGDARGRRALTSNF